MKIEPHELTSSIQRFRVLSTNDHAASAYVESTRSAAAAAHVMTTEPNDSRPVEERVADRIDTSHPSQRWPGWAATQLRRLGRLDRAAYRAVSGISTPWLDTPLRLVSEFANFSKPWLATAAVMAAVGGSRGRRAAAAGLASIAVTSLLVNQPMKLAGERPAPRPAAARCARAPMGADAAVHLVPLGSLGFGGRVRGRGRAHPPPPSLPARAPPRRSSRSRGSTPACTTRAMSSRGWPSGR